MVLGDYQGAIEDFNTALEQDPKLVLALNNRGYAHYFFGNMDAALDDFDMAISLDRDFGEACLNKAALLARQDQLKEAISLLDGAIADNPDMALLYLNRGLIRNKAYELVQQEANKAWSKGLNFKELIYSNPKIRKILSDKELEKCFDHRFNEKKIIKAIDRAIK